MKLSEIISRLQGHQVAHGDVFIDSVDSLLGIGTSKQPAVFCTTNLFYPTINPDGSYNLPGRDDLARMIVESLNESLHGRGGNILSIVGWKNDPVKEIPSTHDPNPIQPPIIVAPPPAIEDAPTLSWPVATATNQQVINAINKEFGSFGLIPADILKDMVFRDDAKKINHREKLYRTLSTARALENWNLPPNVLERVKSALKKYTPPLF